VLACVFLAAAPAHAVYTTTGMQSATFNLRITGVNPTWDAYLTHGVTSWNGTCSSTMCVTISFNSSSPRTMTAGNYSETWWGEYQPGGWPWDRTFAIRANATSLSASTLSTMDNRSKMTAAHELGHALSLADNPSTTSASIMKYPSTSAGVLTVPTTFDKTNVKNKY